MHPNLNSPYTTFTLSEQEETESAILSPTQRARVQNLRVETLEQKLSLVPSSLTPDQFGIDPSKPPKTQKPDKSRSILQQVAGQDAPQS